jgi:AraC family transcriptional regulator
MTYSHQLPILQDDGGVFPADASCRLIQSSAETRWKHILIEQHQIGSGEWDNLMFKRHVLVVNVGRATNYEFKKNGRFQKVVKPTGTISLFPSCQPFFLRANIETSRVADLIFLALDPGFVARTAESSGLQSDRLELVEQRRPYDSTLLHLTLALIEGLRTEAAADPLYGEALSTALTLHLLREYTTAKPKVQPSRRKLTRPMLLRAVEFIQDHLAKELTVSSIAEAVSVSPYYFTRLFKEATGKSPHQFIIEARVYKARHLLESGNISIGQAAYEVGFVDQSHLTRHFKRTFGLPPKAFFCKSGL